MTDLQADIGIGVRVCLQHVNCAFNSLPCRPYLHGPSLERHNMYSPAQNCWQEEVACSHYDLELVS